MIIKLFKSKIDIFYYHSLSILSFLKKNNIYLEYQCKEGFCGICKVKILKGRIKYIIEPIAFLKKKEILTCCSIPRENITLDI